MHKDHFQTLTAIKWENLQTAELPAVLEAMEGFRPLLMDWLGAVMPSTNRQLPAGGTYAEKMIQDAFVFVFNHIKEVESTEHAWKLLFSNIIAATWAHYCNQLKWGTREKSMLTLDNFSKMILEFTKAARPKLASLMGELII